MPRWGNRLAKAGIVVTVLGVVGGTGWLAGNGAATPPAPAADLPATDLSPKTIEVGTASLVSRLVVDATVRADPPVPVRPAKPGTVAAVHRSNGQRVGKGEPLLTIKAPGTGKKAKPVNVAVTAPVAGRISGLTAVTGQELSPADAVAQLDPGRFQAVATIDGKEVYKLYNRPESITMAIDHGPAPFSCRLLKYGAGASGRQQQDSGPEGGGGAGGDNVEVTCRIPARQRVFAGIRGKLSITTDSVRDAVVVPLSAVLGEAGKGRVTVVGAGGERKSRPVKLGINDGKQVEVLDGLEKGEKILDRAPLDAEFDVPEPKAEPEQGG
ncbi:efflux RND transporter periplasmic adaptor subunit [Spirillospora sp. CA-294931]|uniref:efflux RND transporter periplasmic adaptor subunit n=1 Tax=Spirillospora sp. CA-294931 TaxID=3240042 RepID=UPI003D9244DD